MFTKAKSQKSKCEMFLSVYSYKKIFRCWYRYRKGFNFKGFFLEENRDDKNFISAAFSVYRKDHWSASLSANVFHQKGRKHTRKKKKIYNIHNFICFAAKLIIKFGNRNVRIFMPLIAHKWLKIGTFWRIFVNLNFKF